MNEDLKWLAENVHEWEQGAHYLVKTLDGGCNWVVGEMEIRDNAANYYTRAQWKAARDELSGKPSWDDAPDWANWIAQSKLGHWECYADKPAFDEEKWIHSGRGECVGFEKYRGEVLGDWRDTLEHRPDNHSNETTEKVWRGPFALTPNTRYFLRARRAESLELLLEAQWSDGEWLGYEVEPEYGNEDDPSDCYFANRSEEDKAVEEMMRIWVSTTGTDGQRMQALYRAGYIKQENLE